MEVEDRHLNVMVDLINKLLGHGECVSLMYLSEQFIPTDIVHRLAKLITLYENNILSESPFLSILQKEPNSEPNYCLTIGSIVKLWLLDFYKQDFVTLNKLDVESGFEEEIILTTLMVLRVLYRMRQLMEQRVHRILTEEWKDLHEFDQQLDQKFDMKCMKLMSLLVKHSINYSIRTNALFKQIDGLREENNNLIQNLWSYQQNSLAITPPHNNSPQIRITTNIEQSFDNSDDTICEDEPQIISVEPPQQQQVLNGCEVPIENHIKIVTKSPLKRQLNSPKKPLIIPTEKTEKRENETVKVSSPPSRLRISPSPKQTTPKKSKTISLAITRRSPRISKVTSKPTTQKTAQVKDRVPQTIAQKAFREIRAVFSETDDSETENIEKRPIKSPNKVIKQLKPITIEPEVIEITAITVNNSAPNPLPEPIPLPLKKRKQKILSLSPFQEVLVPQIEKKTEEKPKKSTKNWPSRSKNYPRKKRYPCTYNNCSYIADRPSTLVRHCRAHTGEKPFACNYPGCDKRYKMSSNLTPHKLTHTGEKPYACDWTDCDKSFTYPQHLKRHRLSHVRTDRLRRSKQLSKTDSSKRLKNKLIAITSD